MPTWNRVPNKMHNYEVKEIKKYMEKKEGVQRVPYGYFDVKVDSYVQRYKNKRLDFIGG